MATLVGRHCWVEWGALQEGQITRQNFDPDWVTVLKSDGESVTVGVSSVYLTIDKVLARCEDNIRYWCDKHKELLSWEATPATPGSIV